MSDMAQALAQAPRPKGGMQRIPFSLESYQHVSSPLSSKLLLNFYAEQEPKDSRNDVVLMPCQGLTTNINVGTGPIVALGMAQDRLYVVSGDHLYRVTANTPSDLIEDLGYVGTPSVTGLPPFVSIAVGATALVVCVPPNAYT